MIGVGREGNVRQMTTDSPPARGIGALTAAVGLLGVARPQAVARLAAGRQAVPREGIVRLLGARYLLQSAAELSRPTRLVLRIASGVDGLHAVSMVGAAIAFPAYRRATLCSAALAGVSALATAVSATKATANG